MTDLKHGSVAYQGSVGEVGPMDPEEVRLARRATARYAVGKDLSAADLSILLSMLGLGEVRS